MREPPTVRPWNNAHRDPSRVFVGHARVAYEWVLGQRHCIQQLVQDGDKKNIQDMMTQYHGLMAYRVTTGDVPDGFFVPQVANNGNPPTEFGPGFENGSVPVVPNF